MKDSNTDVLLMYKGLLLTGKSDKTRFIDEMGRKNKWQGLIITNDRTPFVYHVVIFILDLVKYHYSRVAGSFYIGDIERGGPTKELVNCL